MGIKEIVVFIIMLPRRVRFYLATFEIKKMFSYIYFYDKSGNQLYNQHNNLFSILNSGRTCKKCKFFGLTGILYYKLIVVPTGVCVHIEN